MVSSTVTVWLSSLQRMEKPDLLPEGFQRETEVSSVFQRETAPMAHRSDHCFFWNFMAVLFVD